MKYNFTTIKVLDIEGKEFPGIIAYKSLADLIYQGANTVDLLEKARLINKGVEVDLTPEEIKEVNMLINHPQKGFSAFVKKPLLDYIDSVKVEPKK